MFKSLPLIFLLVACGLLFPVRTGLAAEVRLAGPSASWRDLVVVTNSLRSAVVLSEVDHAVVNTSEVDTCLSLLPDWSAWRRVPDGAFDAWVEVVSDSSNAVSVLLGDPETPALTIACESDWAILPAGTLPPDEPVVPRFGASTNRLHLALRPVAGSKLGHAFIETQIPGDDWIPRPELIPTNFTRLDAPQTIPNWPKVGVWTAGPRAAVTDLRMRWCVDETVIICW